MRAAIYKTTSAGIMSFFDLTSLSLSLSLSLSQRDEFQIHQPYEIVILRAQTI